MSIEKFALMTKDLFENVDTILGRENYKNTDFKKDLIVVDSLSPAVPISNMDTFNGIVELMNYDTYVRQLATVDFFGDNAETNANKFLALLRSQKATELKEVNKLNVFPANSITKLSELVGTTYYNRYQVEVNLKYTIEVGLKTLRIDTPDISQLLIDK